MSIAAADLAAADAGVSAAAHATPWTVLCVDDEPNILSALKRSLRAPGYRVLTAGGGPEALEVMQAEPVDLVLCDMRMPGMDGAQLLERVRAGWPQTIRVLVTGHADLSATVAAINRGQIFRYLTKPWDDAELHATVRQGLELLALEREKLRLEALTSRQNAELRDANALLEQRVQERTAELSVAHHRIKRSYLTSIQAFSGLLELRAGRLVGHGRRVADTAQQVARAMQMPEDEVQQVFVAALLHDIGLMGSPDVMLSKPVARYNDDEVAAYQRHPGLGEQLLMPLQDMQAAAALIRSHHERCDGSGFPERLAGSQIALGARILAVAEVFDELQHGHIVESTLTAAEARLMMRRGRGTQFDAEVLDVFLHITEPERPKAGAELYVTTAALEAGMVLARDLVSHRGVLMLTAGHVLSLALIRRIREFEAREGGKLNIVIRPPGSS